MRRLIATSAIVAILVITAIPGVYAATQRDTWDDSYSLSPTEFCGFAVDVHDYGSNNYFRVSSDGWTWAKQWEGTRDYTNPVTDATASMVWSWMTTQTVASQTDTTIKLVISSHGTVGVIASSGRVVAHNSGQETFERNLALVGQDWIQVGPDNLLGIKGPHPMDFGNAFCDAIGPLLNP